MAKTDKAALTATEPTMTEPTPEPSTPTPPPERTIVSTAARRPVGYDSFADLTAIPVVQVVESGGVTSVTFAEVLEDRARQAVWERMTSRDDADQAARAALRQARDAAAGAPSNEAGEHALTIALLLANRELG